MSMLLAFLLIASTPQITLTQALAPAEATASGNAIIWKSEQLAVRLEPLDEQAFMGWLKKRGVTDRILNHQALRNYLNTFAVFRVSLYNFGEDNLVFNPEQVMLRNKRGPVGFLVNINDVLRTQHGHSDPELEKLAQLFHQETFELEPGRKVGRVIAFKPLDRKFPKKVQLVIDRLYYGIVSNRVAGGYQVRYTQP